jgi:phospho-N-acetylmuramoyl-pentapeptide-transferase
VAARVRIRQTIRRTGRHPPRQSDDHGRPAHPAAIVVPTLLWGNLSNRYVLLILTSTIWLGIWGFVDDYLHIVKNQKGLLGRYKMLMQLALGLAVGTYLYLNPIYPPAATRQRSVSQERLHGLRHLLHPFVAIVITGASNASADRQPRRTGGRHGGHRRGGVRRAAYVTGHARFSGYLSILYLSGTGELTVFLAAMVGAALGFLWYNSNPASVFMGDTGSLALGGALGTAAVLLKREFLLVVIGGIFVIEALSVIIQVVSYKTRHKRVFKMSPIHHHFELCGWPEQKVVVRFWIIAALFALLSLSTLKLQ